MNNLKSLILAKITTVKQLKAADIVRASGFSRTYVNRALQDLRDEGRILLLGKANKAVYILADARSLRRAKENIKNFSETFLNENLSEEYVLKRIQDQTGVLFGLKKNINNIVTYALLEMVNNAIEHSRSDKVIVAMERIKDEVNFAVRDGGVGIFNKIKQEFGLSDILSAIQQLLKGKQSTDAARHTGQGIFFTSKMADSFTIRSSGKVIRFFNEENFKDIILEDCVDRGGTEIYFNINVNGAKTAQAIFAEYTDKDTFDFSKTKVLVKLFEVDKNLLSRSEARRVMMGLDKFRDIVLDFNGVETVGQSFADEIFRVWKNANPGKNIGHINADENVEFMIKRAVA